jgi:hypothetical protein
MQLEPPWMVPPECAALLRPPPDVAEASGHLSMSSISPESKQGIFSLPTIHLRWELPGWIVETTECLVELYNRVDINTPSLSCSCMQGRLRPPQSPH